MAPRRPDPMTVADVKNYTTGVKWLMEHIDHEAQRIVKYSDESFNLDRMRSVLGLLGNPQSQVRAVHVAGTKGKGSTCHMVSSMLEACGYTVGLFTSPHLIDLRERITINGVMVTYPAATQLFRQVAEAESKMTDGPLTFFEIITAMAFKHFADEAVDVAVLETGLGGRLDCTNVCEPMVTAITQISLDHMHILGESLPEIATEKAGIFKANVPAITIDQPGGVMNVFKEQAERIGAPLMVTGKDIDFSSRFESNRELGPHTRVCLTTERSKFEHLAVPLKGEHQAMNCGLALSIIDSLKGHDFNLPDAKVIEGLAKTPAQGRMEQVWPLPRVYIDGAHNPSSLQALIKALGAHIQYDSLVMIFGCNQDKDVDGMLEQVALGADKLVLTQAKGQPRACEPEFLKNRFGELSTKMVQTAPNLTEAIKVAARAVSREDLVLVTGSFYLAGEARKYFLDKAAKSRKK